MDRDKLICPPTLRHGGIKIFSVTSEGTSLKLFETITKTYQRLKLPAPILKNCIGGVMVSMLALSAVDHGFKP
jgi:hypothetical protein